MQSTHASCCNRDAAEQVFVESVKRDNLVVLVQLVRRLQDRNHNTTLVQHRKAQHRLGRIPRIPVEAWLETVVVLNICTQVQSIPANEKMSSGNINPENLFLHELKYPPTRLSFCRPRAGNGFIAVASTHQGR